MSDRRKIVLVGFGRMGRNHFRVLQDNPLVELVAVVDPFILQPANRALIPDTTKPLTSLGEIASLDFDALVIATPTQTHFEVVKELLALKKPILVEKPICSTPEQGEELIKLSREAGVLLAVGHVERQNPAIRKLKEVVESGIIGQPIHCSVTRVGGYPDNVQEGNNVLLDLAVHDLDVLQMVFGPFDYQSSFVHSTVKEGIFDTAQIMGVCSGGVSADIHVNWITPTKIRAIRLTGTYGVCFVDYMLQTCSLMGGNLLKHRPDTYFSYNELIEMYRGSDKIEFGVTRQEPLRVQLDQFLNALNGKPHSLCLAPEATRVVRLAEQSLNEARKMQSGRIASNQDTPVAKLAVA
jgi:UDP-N-acetylglucosamine 3-dehydrogenase